MNQDWNWFFSSFAQSAAALIGIIVAYLISRILSLSEQVNKLVSKFTDLNLNYLLLKEKLNSRKFKWYNESIIEKSDLLKKEISKNKFNNLTDRKKIELLYNIEPTLFKIYETNLSALNNIISEFEKKNKQDVLNYSFNDLDFTTQSFWNTVQEEKEKINEIKTDVYYNISNFIINKEEMKSLLVSFTPIKVIISILLITFPLTVVYPLHFLPQQNGVSPILIYDPFIIIKTILSLKNMMLLGFLIPIEGILIYFLFLVSSLKKDLKVTYDLSTDEFIKIESYSIYLKKD